MIKELIKLANELDGKGLHEEADYVDSILENIAEGALKKQDMVKNTVRAFYNKGFIGLSLAQSLGIEKLIDHFQYILKRIKWMLDWDEDYDKNVAQLYKNNKYEEAKKEQEKYNSILSSVWDKARSPIEYFGYTKGDISTVNTTYSTWEKEELLEAYAKWHKEILKSFYQDHGLMPDENRREVIEDWIEGYQ